MIDYAVLHIRAKKWAEKQFVSYYGKEELSPGDALLEMPQQEAVMPPQPIQEVTEDASQSGIRQVTE